MTLPAVPPALRQFIVKHIHSIAEMEALAMMVGAPDTVWTVELLAARLYVSPEDATAVLRQMTAHGLTEKQAHGHRFACRTSEVATNAKALVALYAEQLIAVTHLIHANRPARVQAFADAFQLRKKE